MTAIRTQRAFSLLMVIVMLVALPTLLLAQTILVHEGDQATRISLNDMDSLSFSEVTLGIPSQIRLNVNRNGFEYTENGWAMSVIALVTDQNGTPVRDGLPVEFSVDTEEVEIQDAVTGNASPQGGSTNGVAFSYLIFGSELTNQPVLITASCSGSGGVIEQSLETKLFPQEPTGVFTVTPGNFTFDNDHRYAVFEMRFYVEDGHQQPVPGEEVLFAPQIGSMYESSEIPPTGPVSPLGVTNAEGYVQRYLIMSQTHAFPDPTAPISTCTIGGDFVNQATATIEPFTVYLYQPGGAREGGEPASHE